MSIQEREISNGGTCFGNHYA